MDFWGFISTLSIVCFITALIFFLVNRIMNGFLGDATRHENVFIYNTARRAAKDLAAKLERLHLHHNEFLPIFHNDMEIERQINEARVEFEILRLRLAMVRISFPQKLIDHDHANNDFKNMFLLAKAISDSPTIFHAKQKLKKWNFNWRLAL